MTDNHDEKIGYGRPPKRTQFQPGKSGNPQGRRTGVSNFESDLSDVLNEEVSIRENGVERKSTKQRAIIDVLVTAAVRGDMRATITLMQFCTRANAQSNEPTTNLSSPEDREILKTLKARTRKLRKP